MEAYREHLFDEDVLFLTENVCFRCDNWTFCDNYGRGDCFAIKILEYLMKKGKITKDDINSFFEDKRRKKHG